MDNWLVKYSPKSSKDIVGNQQQIQLITKFVKQFANRKNVDSVAHPNIIVTGPIGIGKSMAVDLVLKENKVEKITTNLINVYCKKTKSDNSNMTRSVEAYYQLLQQTKKLNISGAYEQNNIALVFDDLCSISNPKKKDIIRALIKINNKYKKFPIIIIANNKHNKMVGELKKMISYPVKVGAKSVKKVNEVVLRVPQHAEIKAFIQKIATAEKLNLHRNLKSPSDDLYVMIISHSQLDMRRLVNIMEELKQLYGCKEITTDVFKSYVEISRKKDMNPGIYEATRMLLNNYDGIGRSLEIYSDDRPTIPLMVHENYPSNISNQYPTLSVEKKLDMLVETSKYISESDKIDGLIYSSQCWSLQPVHGLFSCTFPSFIVNEKVPDKICNTESYVYTKDYNKTSIKKINRKVIKKTRENPLLKTMSVKDFLIMCAIMKDLIVKKKVDELCDLLIPYKFTYLKEIESVISIDKLEKGSVNIDAPIKEALDDKAKNILDTCKIKNKYKIKGKMKVVMMDKLGLREEEKKKGGKKGAIVAKRPAARKAPVKKDQNSPVPKKTVSKGSGSKTAAKRGPKPKIAAVRVTKGPKAADVSTRVTAKTGGK